jgi:hypothetical protein
MQKKTIEVIGNKVKIPTVEQLMVQKLFIIINFFI